MTKQEKDDIAFILNALRKSTIAWGGRKACLDRARKKFFDRRHKKTGKKIFKYHWRCEKCREWYRDEKSMEVDHVVEIGGFRGDWNVIIARMFNRDPKALQCLCVVCHKKKTSCFNASRLYSRKSND